MATKKRHTKTAKGKPEPRVAAVEWEPLQSPLRIARGLSAVVFVVGLVMLALGGGVVIGKITEGWGFPMSAVPNWGRPWGLVLMTAAAAYLVGPVLLLTKPRKGWIVMMIVSGLSVLVGTPLITTTAEIAYNLFQETKSRPDWIDSIWAYFMFLHITLCVALYRACPAPRRSTAAG